MLFNTTLTYFHEFAFQFPNRHSFAKDAEANLESVKCSVEDNRYCSKSVEMKPTILR